MTKKPSLNWWLPLRWLFTGSFGAWQATQWNGLSSLQEAIGSSLVASIWLGILFMGFGLLFVIDWSVFQMPMKSKARVKYDA